MTAAGFLAEGGHMSQTTFLTPEEVAERYRGSVSVGTLRNWRVMKIGPSFVKIGKAVLYRVDELEAWDDRIVCSAAPQGELNKAMDRA
jgi:hypothetical protein